MRSSLIEDLLQQALPAFFYRLIGQERDNKGLELGIELRSDLLQRGLERLSDHRTIVRAERDSLRKPATEALSSGAQPGRVSTALAQAAPRSLTGKRESPVSRAFRSGRNLSVRKPRNIGRGAEYRVTRGGFRREDARSRGGRLPRRGCGSVSSRLRCAHASPSDRRCYRRISRDRRSRCRSIRPKRRRSLDIPSSESGALGPSPQGAGRVAISGSR